MKHLRGRDGHRHQHIEIAALENVRGKSHRREEKRHHRSENVGDGDGAENSARVALFAGDHDHSEIHRAEHEGEKHAENGINDRGRNGGRRFRFLFVFRSRAGQQRLHRGDLYQYEEFFHLSVNSMNTSSSDDVPFTSSISPTATSSPPLMIAIRLQSFSATSRTWVENRTAPPFAHISRI